MVNETAALSDALMLFQQGESEDHAEACLAIALTRVVEKKVRPSLAKKLHSQDVDDVCSEVILGFWKLRHSVRPDECDKLVNTLVHRRTTDQVREYYRDSERRAHEPAADERELLALLPARDAEPGTEASQDVWELLSTIELKAKDRVIAYMVYLGAEKRVIATVLSIDSDTVTNSLKRCREALLKQGYGKAADDDDG